MVAPGKLYLIPVYLGSPFSRFMSSHLIQTVHHLRHFIVENEKTARAFLKSVATPVPLSELTFSVLDEHTDAVSISRLLEPLINGNDCGLMSEAGCPGVADPGSALVRLAHQQGIKVIPIAGPSSILLGLMASGLNGQCFKFNGYLSREKSIRQGQLRELERLVLKNNETQLFIETPYRNGALLDDLLNVLHAETLLCIACEINSPTEDIRTLTVQEWKSRRIDLQKRPCIFLIGQSATSTNVRQKQDSAPQHRQRRYRR